MEQRNAVEAAQSVIEQAQAQSNARKNTKASAVLPIYRFVELKPLEPWQRHAVIRQASALAYREPAVVALCGTWLALIVALAFAAPAWFHGLAVTATVLLFVLPFLLYHRSRVKHHVRQLLRASAMGQQA
jgi:hypothetical protein